MSCHVFVSERSGLQLHRKSEYNPQLLRSVPPRQRNPTSLAQGLGPFGKNQTMQMHGNFEGFPLIVHCFGW